MSPEEQRKIDLIDNWIIAFRRAISMGYEPTTYEQTLLDFYNKIDPEPEVKIVKLKTENEN